ncbi:MAG: Asp-tRNA(Asn)/Glu-tRNA(Gln) amidotransferase subunit GatB [Bacillota bacterium]
MEYEIVIGLEVHSELATKSKIYCTCTTSFGGEPNTHCCPICIGMPGVLPVLNRKVVEFAAKAGLATNCKISSFSKQDRKNYFYPDLPKAYQTSQFDLPLCVGGYIDIVADENKKRIGITRIHIEEDAGKLMHDKWGTGSLVDYNRCGVPLIEIVSEPDMRSATEVKLYLEQLKSILEYTEVSDCRMQEGSLRADVNLSVRPFGQSTLGTRTEMKNLNSFRAIVRAVEHESKRQIELIEGGNTITQETRRWDDDKGTSYSMRSKEEAHDYRYFPEPDLVPIIVDESWLNEIKESLPELQEEKKIRYLNDFLLPEYDASIITSSKYIAVLFEESVSKGCSPKVVSNWIIGEVMRQLNDNNIDLIDIPISGDDLSDLILLVENSKISMNIAKKVLKIMFDTGEKPSEIVIREGLEIVNDAEEILAIVQKVIKSNPQSVSDFMAGKEKAIGFLVGQVMRESKGKADPAKVNVTIKEELNKL